MNRKVSNFLVVISTFVLFSVATAILMIGCSEKVTKEDEGAVIIKSLYAPSSVQKGHTGMVDVEVKDDGDRPVSGVGVSFSVSPASIGYFTPTVDTTDDNGLSASVFSATGLGTATIQVSVQGAQPKTAQIEVVSAGETTKPIEIEITPSWLPADGISTSIIKATITDSTGTLVEDSTMVKFVAGEEFDDVDGDGYFTEGIDNLIHDTNQDGKWNPIGAIPAYAFTQSGVAQVTYTAGFRTGTAYIKASADLGSQQLQEQSQILLVPTDTVAYIVLTSDRSTIQVKGTGGVEAAQITATCYDDNGNRVGKDFPVEFYIIDSPGGGEALNGDIVTPVTINTNSYGEAYVTLLSGTKSGTVILRAKVGTVFSTSTVIVISDGPSSECSVEIELIPSSLPADGISTSMVKVTIKNSSGNLVEDSTLVKFEAGEKFEDVDGDGYYTEGIDELIYDANQDKKWNPIGTIPAYAFTQNGVAQVTYTAGFRTGTAYIKVTAGLGCEQVPKDCPILLVPADTVAYIAWTSDRSIIYVKGSCGIEAAQITATCHDDNGNRVGKGFPVEFSIVDGPGGGEALNGDAVNPVTINTNSKGEASVTLLSGTKSGTVTLQARVGNMLSTCFLVTISDGLPNYMEIEIIPTWLPADGISTSIIKATVADSIGTLVEDGTVVKFVAGEEFDDVDGDGYYTEGIDNLIHDTNQDGKWNPIGAIPAYAFTQNGVAQVTYTAGFRTGTAYIKATADLGDQRIQEQSHILLVPTDSVAFIVLIPDQSSIQVKGTGGMEATHITATCYDDNGNRVGEDFSVEFYVLYGPEGGENLNGDINYPVTVNTNSWGEAVVTLLSGTKSGVVRLQAKVGGVLSAAPLVTICSGPPFDISVGVTPCNIRGWDINCVEAQLCACVVDVYGNPVPDSTSVHFYTDEGMVYCCDQTKAGCAYSTFISADPRIDGIATICAETKGEDGIISNCTNLIVSGPPNSVTFLNYPLTLLADGVSKGDVLVEVLDVNDNFAVDQTPVEMKTSFGSVPSGNTSDGCYASLYETELTSQVLPQDYSMTSLYEDDGIGAINILTAKSGFVSNSVSVTFLTANTYSKNCEIDIEASVPHGSTVPVVVIIRDRYGNPLGGHYIEADQAHTSGGTVAGSAYTNEFGEATGFIFTATTDPAIESGVVSFCDEDPRGGVCIAVKIEISDD